MQKMQWNWPYTKQTTSISFHVTSKMEPVVPHTSNALGKWLKRDFGLTAHSLRHKFRDRLRASGCPLELMDQIGGWSSVGTIGSKYGKGYELEMVRKRLDAIKVTGLNREQT